MGKQFLEATPVFSRTAVNGSYCTQTEARNDDKKATNKQVNNNANKKKVFCCQENTLFLISIVIA